MIFEQRKKKLYGTCTCTSLHVHVDKYCTVQASIQSIQTTCTVHVGSRVFCITGSKLSIIHVHYTSAIIVFPSHYYYYCRLWSWMEAVLWLSVTSRGQIAWPLGHETGPHGQVSTCVSTIKNTVDASTCLFFIIKIIYNSIAILASVKSYYTCTCILFVKDDPCNNVHMCTCDTYPYMYMWYIPYVQWNVMHTLIVLSIP